VAMYPFFMPPKSEDWLKGAVPSGNSLAGTAG
jgi:hypothetical protein